MKSKKIILTTAHSELDSHRDLTLWKKLMKEEYGNENCNPRYNADSLKYQINPFCSRIGHEDPFPPDEIKNGDIHLVNPNHSVMII